MLRPVILGWANYFKYCECKTVFSKLTHLIYQKLRAWVFRRDTRTGRLFVKEKYFPSNQVYHFDGSEHKDNWVLVGGKKNNNNELQEVHLPHISWCKSQKHVKIKGTQTPFNLDLYWTERSAKHSPYPLRVRTLFVRQNFHCPICKKKPTELDAQSWEVDHITPKARGGKDEYKNLQLLHKECHLHKTQMEKSKRLCSETK